MDNEIDGVAASSTQITRANHFVPQGLLKRWSLDGKTVQVYDLVVPHVRVPLWSLRSVRNVAVRRDLYTRMTDGKVSDELEVWFGREVETPGLAATERLIEGERLTADEWHAVICFYMAQEIRTPLTYIEQMQRWERDMPSVLQKTTKRSMEMYTRAQREGRLDALQTAPSSDSGLFKFDIQRNAEPGTGGVLAIEVPLGRELWHHGIRQLMEGRALAKLLRYRWCVLVAAPGLEWPLTDQPAVRLGFRGPNDLNFQVGISRRRADLMMPLSPHHLLHVEVGTLRRGFHQLSWQETIAFRKALVQRAFRSVIASRPVQWIPTERPRIVSREQFEAEREGWSNWHADQIQAAAS